MKKSLIFIAVLMVALISTSCDQNNVSSAVTSDANTTAKAENTMPSFSCTTNQGNTFNMDETTKPVFINFWATWCGPCVSEMPDLQELYDEYKDKVDFIFINCGDGESEINEFLENSETKYTFPIGYDFDNDLSIKFNVQAIPTTYVVDKDKKIVDVLVGSNVKAFYEEYIKKII